MTHIIQQTKQTNNGHQNTKQETTLLNKLENVVT